jgi:hypothetical protein
MYPQQYQEFLDFLDSNPEYLHDMRIRLLTPELIALPEQFAQLVTTVTDLAERFAAFVETTNKRLTAIEEDVATLKEDVGTLKEDVGTLKNDQATMKNDQATMKNDIASLKGSDMERQAREIILNIAKDELGLTKGHILLARGKNTAPAFAAAMTKAEEEGLVTEEQESDVMVADIIIRARRTLDKLYVHAVFEVSRTIRNDDIERAAKRAAAVAEATGEETIAAVIGERIQPPQQALAEKTGVRVILPAMFRQNKEDEELAA